MVDDVKPTVRNYDSSRRRSAARQTRRAILEAATGLFTTHGYGATSLQAIADEAGVAVQTIYATLRNKPTILAEALDLAIAGDDEAVAVNQRDWMNEVWTAPTGDQRLRAYARAVAQIMTRASEMFMVVAERGAQRRSAGGPRSRNAATATNGRHERRPVGDRGVTPRSGPRPGASDRHRLAPQQPGRPSAARPQRRLVDRGLHDLAG